MLLGWGLLKRMLHVLQDCLLPDSLFDTMLRLDVEWSHHPLSYDEQRSHQSRFTLKKYVIKFDENACIDEDVKPFIVTVHDLIEGLVDVTTNANTSQHIISDVITGKGGGLIAALHEPPGTGKTLTADVVAEHLKRPLYIISSIELSLSTLESRLSGVLSLERNALVSVALEYHRELLFLTTNRI
ncbi:hypothetical protein K503DRAFT_782762 [Rhizopogon vinicolor AM-OR11-026]|uniref:ATPase AAA-type core domain-containing protein n=1 Tax=Rhizopogon vinicolor AM-OR11-026 TaxID=1314800 RepID=A0A1B7N150_9AGAM|nr:hypothetical protein K503DRAFT_782762 [Rhizopogon vinicolor AM-OR11-026]